MNLKWVIRIFDYNEIFLYEIIEDYKNSSPHNKEKIFKEFCETLWKCSNKRRIYTKSVHYNVKNCYVETNIGKIFDIYSTIEYKYHRSNSNNKNWCDIIRQKINNLYTKYFDESVVISKEYMDLLKTPKYLYYRWVNGEELNEDYILETIDSALYKADLVKKDLQKEKMKLSWGEYKKVIEKILKRTFENCKVIEDYEEKNVIPTAFNFLTEDHFYVKYINKCLDGEMRNFKKNYYGLYVKGSKNKIKYGVCKKCKSLFQRKTTHQQYCTKCLQENPYYKKIGIKTVKCIDCGKEFEVDARNMVKTRCIECYKIHRRKNKMETMRKLRNK